MRRKVILSGADGFVGSHLARYLSAEGFEVFALVYGVNCINDLFHNLENTVVIPCDLNQYEDVVQLLPVYAEAFLHFAWNGVSPELRNNIEIQHGNIVLAENAVELARKLKTKKFVFPGSTLEYCYTAKTINRHTKPAPKDAYGIVKIEAGNRCRELCKQYRIPFIYTIISSIYSADRFDSNVITYTITQLLQKKVPKLTRLEQLWDYVHIDDVVLAYKLIIQHGKDQGFYTIGHGDNCPLSDYIYQIRDIIDPTLSLGIGEIPYQDGILPMSCVDLTEIKEDTGFIPQIDFPEGIKEVINEIRRNLYEKKT